MIKITTTKNYLIVAIIFLIGFQAFPVIKIGGSFKVYELLSLALLIFTLATIEKFIFAGNVAIVGFCFFVVSPLISYLCSVFILNYPDGFYRRYPSVDSFKFNYYVFPVLQIVYMVFNFTTINAISISGYVYRNLNAILKYTVYIGSFIALYSYFAMFVKDVVVGLPKFIQNKSWYEFRSSGFSQEPSFYVLYQAWVCIINWYTKPLFKKSLWYILMFLNIGSLLLTFSSSLVALLLVVLTSAFILKSSIVIRSRIIIIVSILLVAIYGAMIYFDLTSTFEYTFIEKITNFFSAPTNTMDSGSYRSYTSAIGFEIFKDHWLTGVGVGNSTYYMYIYEFKMGIVEFLNVLEPGIFPQNTPSSVLSEQGIIGGVLFFIFILLILRKVWIHRNKSNYNKMFLIGTLFNITVMLTIAPVYSLFLWVFLSIALCYIRHFNNKVTTQIRAS